MDVKRIQDGPERIYAIRFSTGEDPMAGLQELARRRELTASSLTAIGAFERAVLGFFDYDRKEYERIPVEEQCEVVSLLGNIALTDGEPSLHIHTVLGVRGGRAVAGHLLEATVRPTLEIMLTETPAHLVRCKDATTGLSLLSPEKGKV
jgi:predicted DNA-binding protein with PD1-like motif